MDLADIGANIGPPLFDPPSAPFAALVIVDAALSASGGNDAIPPVDCNCPTEPEDGNNSKAFALGVNAGRLSPASTLVLGVSAGSGPGRRTGELSEYPDAPAGVTFPQPKPPKLAGSDSKGGNAWSGGNTPGGALRALMPYGRMIKS